MPARITLQPGHRLPEARIARLTPDGVRARPAFQSFGNVRAIIVGLPGAFTPICTRTHLPDFVKLSRQFKASGFDVVACIAPNDPWTLKSWAEQIDPTGELEFYSDGNGEFGRATGLVSTTPDLFLGERLARFTMMTRGGIVEKLAVERSILEVTCSSAYACLTLSKTAAA